MNRELEGRLSDERYFRRRAPTRPAEFEAGYWHVVTDPDGRERNRLAERELHLADLREELAFAEARPAGRVLDVGCGLGFYLSALGPSWERHGVELSSFAAERAAEWAKVHVGTLESASYQDRWFDLVVAHHVIEHVADPSALAREIFRVLAPGGTLVLGTPDFDSGCARRFGANYRLLHDDTHVSLFSADGMHRFLRDHGFVVERVAFPFFETRHFTPENLLRLFDTGRVSPPFHGNFMTFYCRRPTLPRLVAALGALGAVTPADALRAETHGATSLSWLRSVRARGLPLHVVAERPTFAAHVALLLADELGLRAEVASGAVPPGEPALLLDPKWVPRPDSLAIVDEKTPSPEPVLPFPLRVGAGREPAQLLLVEALLAELAEAP